MTVQEVIKQLEQIDNKTVLLMIDCPHCGYANEIKEIREIVVLSSLDKKN